MARIRSIKPGFCTSLKIARLSIPAQLHFVKLWTYADDSGRGVDHAGIIRGALWSAQPGFTDEAVEKLQQELEDKGRIVRYMAPDETPLFEIVNWGEHQKPQHPKPSEYPPPGDEPVGEKPHEASPVRSRAPEKPHEDAPEHTESMLPVIGVVVGEGEGDVDGEGVIAPASAAARRADPLFDAVVDVCNIDPRELTPSERGAANKALQSLRSVDATADEVRRRARNWDYPARLTPSGLAKNWASLKNRTQMPQRNAEPRAWETLRELAQ